jgi:tRNA (cytidine56-2'-O)-methyltransferase
MIVVLRLGHRIGRDKRITTHVALVARAFGADKIIIETQDKQIEKNIKSICERFGGKFEIETGIDRKKIIKKWKGVIVHLTMYGQRFDEAITKIDENKDILIIIGAEKVPPEMYHVSDYNVSVGNQPHSEVAALALFLDRFTKGKWAEKQFKGKLKILPCDEGKKVVPFEE